jgi:hypothetical protein
MDRLRVSQPLHARGGLSAVRLRHRLSTSIRLGCRVLEKVRVILIASIPSTVRLTPIVISLHDGFIYLSIFSFLQILSSDYCSLYIYVKMFHLRQEKCEVEADHND